MSEFPQTVEILGAQHVTEKPSFAMREALIMAWGKYQSDRDDLHFLWVYSAVIGECSALSGLARTSFFDNDANLLKYGAAMYSWLSEQGATKSDIAQAALSLLGPMAKELFPRESEVSAVAGFSSAQEPQT